MHDTRRETDDKNTLQYLDTVGSIESSEPETIAREHPSAKIMIISLRRGYPCSG
jgi:hypothetical protein